MNYKCIVCKKPVEYEKALSRDYDNKTGFHVECWLYISEGD